MEHSELAAWLRLLETPGLGLEGARRLLAAAGSVQAVFDLPPTVLHALLSPKQRQFTGGAWNASPETLAKLIDTTWRWLQQSPTHSVLCLSDADYPPALLATADPPLLLYLAGDRSLLNRPCLSIVGSRNPTAQGRETAEHFARDLSQHGLTIVSGLALGVDGAAHQGALQGLGSSIGVLGTGLDSVYPVKHKSLAAAMVAHGLLISEYALGTPALAANFPRRNRIIAGLSQGCLVVEAALRSGSLITARLASEAGREVFAIPGSIHSALSRGCHALIRQGAKLVETIDDVLEELPPLDLGPHNAATLTASTATAPLRPSAPAKPRAGTAPPPATAAPRPPAQQQVLNLMGFDPVSLDALMARGGWEAAELNAHLLELELDGAVARLPGQVFQRQAHA
ncbi:DNA-processing protein DprA [Roseateles koreensis]|uniref:DNA-processing protein DprA n=1 Tax=Roseateles koreensis TaxID=2987526 RepID=A0ABT5KQ47_9BURK|nr:DNA-processing protein DprA [Roseateles koreensis]MDC8784585.1 DNA-processing protein DprA [Roseateles koreensis]